MAIEFAKLNGLGNDFVFIDNRAGDVELAPEQARLLCDRHFGVGADGVILVEESPREECAAYMHYINADGTLAQMCGNGVRCFAKYLVDRGIVDAASGGFVADTLAGPRPIRFAVDAARELTEATVDMGRPIFDPALVPVDAKATMALDDGTPFAGELPIASPWGTFRFTCVSMGNPHAVCLLDDLDALPDELFCDPGAKSLASLDVARIGAFYESAPAFPEKANIEFAVVEGEAISMRVFERGCGETLACGTGACATRVAAAALGRAPRRGIVSLLGGDLLIDWTEEGTVLMTGPAAQAFTGTLELPSC